MEDNILKDISKERKIDFLEKLKSGKFKLTKPFKPAPKLTFKIQPDGLYLAENGLRLSAAEVKALPGYMIMIELVNDRSQVDHVCPPEGFVLIPFSKTDYLSGLLISNDDNSAHSPEDFSEALKGLSISELKQLHASIVEKSKKNNIDQEMNKRINSMKGSIDIEEWIKIEGHSTDVDTFLEKNLSKENHNS